MFTKRPILETERLKIVPLTHNQLINYLQVDGSLEDELGVEPMKRSITPELINAFESIILPAVGNPSKNYLFHTLWTVLDKEKKAMVGDLCFKGIDTSIGEVELIYGMYPQFRHQGYMTEAVSLLCQWAFEQGGINTVVAETQNANIASQKILIKNGFKAFTELNNTTWWRLQKAESIAVERA